MSRTQHRAQKMTSGPRSRKRSEQKSATRRVRQTARRLVRDVMTGGDCEAILTSIPAPKTIYIQHYW